MIFCSGTRQEFRWRKEVLRQTKVLTTSATVKLRKYHNLDAADVGPIRGERILLCASYLGAYATELMKTAPSGAVRQICILQLAWLIAFCTAVLGFGQDVEDKPLQQPQTRKVIVVVGAEGAVEYGRKFDKWVEGLEKTIRSSRAENPNLKLVQIGGLAAGQKQEPSDLDHLENEIKSSTDTAQELWVVLVGHGTDDGKKSKFNLRGPDLRAQQLNDWLTPLPCRCVIVNCASASGAFINKLKSKNRIVVTATRSSSQYNFARFGEHFLQAIGDPTFDLDKDQQVSLLEAFVAGSKRTEDFYVQEGRLATELAVIDDNGDGLGTPANWFEGTRVVRKSKKGKPDGLAANQMFLIRRGAEAKLTDEQRRLRDDLEVKLESLRSRRDVFDEDAYYRKLEPILIELAKVYRPDESGVRENSDPKVTR